MRKTKILQLLTILGFVVMLAPFVLADPIIGVIPPEQNFGEVEVGSSATAPILITNFNGHDLIITDIGFQGGSSSDFAVTMMPVLPTIIKA